MQFLFRSPSMPSAESALPGRDQPMAVPPRHFVNGASLTGPWPDGTRTAIFGLGCFWGAEKDFWETPGVISTAVGYAGGFTPNANYREVCTGKTGHAEVVLVVYDPRRSRTSSS
jgi:peptide-methionine (S)-S-oxide reductase